MRKANNLNHDTRDLQKALADISNYIYVNDGVFKDRAFSDVVRLIALKLSAEGDDNLGLLDPAKLQSVANFEVDQWAAELIQYGVSVGLENSTKAFWNIKESSLLWAAKRLSLFSFKDFPADVKGEAFQALVVNNLRGDRGEYFTPQPLVAAITGIVGLEPESKVIDPACGSGGFLYGAFRSGVKPENLYGLELSDDVAKAARLRVQILGGLAEQVIAGDAFNSAREIEGQFDFVLMNPPFGSRSKIIDKATLERFELPSIDNRGAAPKPLAPELLFLELAIRLLKPGGRMATVIPDGVLQNSSSKFVRDWLAQNASLESIISCPSVTFQPYGTGVKTSILVMQKGQVRKATSTFLAVSQSVGYDARGNQKLRASSGLQEGAQISLDEDLSGIAIEAKNHIAGKSSSFHFGKTQDEVAKQPRWDAEYFDDAELELNNRLKELGYLEISSVADFRTSRFQAPFDAIEVGYIALSDIDARTSQIVNIQNLAPDSLPSRATYAVETGDLITAISGASTGTRKHVSAVISELNKNCVVSSGFAVLRPNNVTSDQLLGFLRSDLFLRQVLRRRTGHAIPTVSHKDFVTILVPPLSNPIWGVWAETMAQLNARAQDLIVFSESTRQPFDL